MTSKKYIAPLMIIGMMALSATVSLAQGPTTGCLDGIVTDENGAVIVGAEVTVVNQSTGIERTAITDEEGRYAVLSLPPGWYRVRVTARGFAQSGTDRDGVQVSLTETTQLDVRLGLAEKDPEVLTIRSLLQTDGSQLGRLVDWRFITELPLASRNYSQILSLSPGVATYLPDSTAVGRNTQTISVNGARVTQNNIQFNGIDANTMGTRSAINVAVPAPETIQEFKVQTSLYDATFGRSGGANVQIITRSGGNQFHGVLYEYFRNDALNANNPFLKATGERRPVLKRNTFGGTLGGPMRKNRAFFFASYQGTRERNGGSILNSLSSNVLIDRKLTDDRSETRLKADYGLASINSAALALLNQKLPNGQFIIPTPQTNGRYSGSAISRFQEDQFNANIDYRINHDNWLAVKFFWANASAFYALPSTRGTGANVPGFGTDEANNVRVFAVQDIHSFSSGVFNELRLGYNIQESLISPSEPVKDTDLGITRSNAALYPGLGLIRINPAAGGVVIGTQTNINPGAPWVATVADTLSMTRGRQTIRIGAEFRFNGVDFAQQAQTRGQIDFPNFNDFLVGKTSASTLGSGIGERNQRAIDYNFFGQDDWKVSKHLTLNLGLRYELDLPPYEKRGLIATFDPSLYRPRPAENGLPVGPPADGFVQAGNVVPQYDVSDVPNVSKYVIHNADLNNLAPRLGFAYSLGRSEHLVLRGGYGVFYSRPTFQYISGSVTAPPTYVLGRRQNAPLLTPFPDVPAQSEFPTFKKGVNLAGVALDRAITTPYFHQFNLSLQSEIAKDLLLEVAYVGTRGGNLFRQVAINQARLASQQHPIINEVTGAIISTNIPTADEVRLRAPFQGVEVSGFLQHQTTARSSYNSFQASMTKRFSHGLQLLASYTFAKSIDDASGAGGGAGIVGIVNPGALADSSPILGNQLDSRANRGVSDFDRTHRFVLNYLWELPKLRFAAHPRLAKDLLSNWQVGSVLVTMSGLPVDIVDSGAGTFYLGPNNGLSRPNWAAGATRRTATSNIPPGYFFNPSAFARPYVPSGQMIPSSGGTAPSGPVALGTPFGTDFGSVGRHALRGPSQTNVDFNITKRFFLKESKAIEFGAEFFNLFNHVNLANPISDFNVVPSANLNPNTGEIRPQSLGSFDFGRIISTSNNPRLIQFALRIKF